MLLEIMENLQRVIGECNPFIKDYCKISNIPNEQLDNGQLVISLNAWPTGEHEHCYNALSV